MDGKRRSRSSSASTIAEPQWRSELQLRTDRLASLTCLRTIRLRAAWVASSSHPGHMIPRPYANPRIAQDTLVSGSGEREQRTSSFDGSLIGSIRSGNTRRAPSCIRTRQGVGRIWNFVKAVNYTVSTGALTTQASDVEHASSAEPFFTPIRIKSANCQCEVLVLQVVGTHVRSAKRPPG